MKNAELVGWLKGRLGESRRCLFGICGPPGSGKSTTAQQVATELGAPVVPMDGFHLSNTDLDARGLRSVKGAPETFDAAGFVALVSDLRRGDRDVVAPVFVRSEDRVRSDGVRVPRDQQVVIVEGNYLLLDEPPWARLVELFDGICYLEVPIDELTRRLVARHVRHGRAPEDAAEFVHRSDLANARRIATGRARATVIVEG